MPILLFIAVFTGFNLLGFAFPFMNPIVVVCDILIMILSFIGALFFRKELNDF